MRYIYITTNLIDGKQYIGQRKTPKGLIPEKDSYLGSGTRLLRAIKKHGRNSFKKEILHKCKTQEEADALEILEINNRNALNNKDKFYNISAGGQFWRSDNHSEITSKAMKDYYKIDENYTAQMLRIARKRYIEGKSPMRYITLADKDILKLRNKQIRLMSERSRQEARKVNELIKQSRKDPNSRSKGGLSLWSKNRDVHMIKLLAAQERRKNNDNKPYHSDNARKSYSIAKLQSTNNKLGLFISTNTTIDYKLIERKIKKIVTYKYKNNDNMIKQIEDVIAIIYKNTGECMYLDKLIKLANITRKLKGVYN